MKKSVSIGVLKSLSKELFRILKNKDLNEMDLEQSKGILTALEVSVLTNKKTSREKISNPIIVNNSKSDLGQLPIVYEDLGFWKKPNVWSLTDQGLRNQVLIYGDVLSGYDDSLMGFGREVIKSEKGLVYVVSSDAQSKYEQIFKICDENKALERLRFIQVSSFDGTDIWGETHTLNILSGMNQKQLSEWMKIVMKTWEESDVDLFKSIPENHENLVSLLSKGALEFKLNFDFLTLVGFYRFFIDACSGFSRFAGQIWENTSTDEQESLRLLCELWTKYLAPFVQEDSSLATDEADVHLLPAIKNKEILVISKPENYPKAFSNMIGASINIASDYLKDEKEVQSVLVVENYSACFSPSLVRNLASLKFSNMGLIWHTNSESNDNNAFCIVPATVIVMRWKRVGFDRMNKIHGDELLKNGIYSAQDLSLWECYLISKNYNNAVCIKTGSADFQSDPPVVKMRIFRPFFQDRNAPKIAFIVKQKKYKYLKEIEEKLACKKSDELFEKRARVLCRACQEKGRISRLSLSWCQNTMAKIMGYSDWHHACQENK